MGKSKKRKQYTREFKLDAVKQIVEGGRSLAEVADSLGLNRSVLGRWKAKFLEEGAVAFPGQGKQTPENAEISRLKRELADARKDLAILKKAAAYFASLDR
jgi:transposase